MEFKFGRLSVCYADCLLSFTLLRKDGSAGIGTTLGPCFITLDRNGDVDKWFGTDYTEYLPKWIAMWPN